MPVKNACSIQKDKNKAMPSTNDNLNSLLIKVEILPASLLTLNWAVYLVTAGMSVAAGVENSIIIASSALKTAKSDMLNFLTINN